VEISSLLAKQRGMFALVKPFPSLPTVTAFGSTCGGRSGYPRGLERGSDHPYEREEADEHDEYVQPRLIVDPSAKTNFSGR